MSSFTGNQTDTVCGAMSARSAIFGIVVTNRITVELLYFDGCPSHEQLLPRVEQMAAQSGASLRLRRVETLEAAERERFLGSPTVRVNGVDVDPTAAGRTDFGLKCRIYRSNAGQSPFPPEQWIRAALERGVAATISKPSARRQR